MSRAGCVQGSPHPVPAGLIHSRQVTPQGQRTPAFAPGTPLQPRARPGWLLHGARPRGAAAGPPARGETARGPPARRAHLAPSALTSGAGAPGSCPGGRRAGPEARPARAGQGAGPAAVSRTPGPLPAPPWRPAASASGARELY